jgi:chromosome partitioning protein
MRTYTFVNQKGGVGKTTTAINLGAYLARMGQRVLLIDIDPQANATVCLGIDHRNVALGSYDLMIGNRTVAECMMHNNRLDLSLIPSTTSLAGAHIELVDMQDREMVLRTAIAPLDGKFDYLLVDCPPSLGLLTLNGLLSATDGVIIPVQCEYLALEGLSQLMATLNRVRSHLFPDLIIRGLLLTMYDVRTNLSQDVAREVRTHFKQQVFKTIIPRSVRLAEAPSHGLPVSEYAPSSAGAIAYRALAMEILKGDGAQIRETLIGAER